MNIDIKETGMNLIRKLPVFLYIYNRIFGKVNQKAFNRMIQNLENIEFRGCAGMKRIKSSHDG